MPDEKSASEWTPRDHYVRATALLIECAEDPKSIRFDPRALMADVHARLATAPLMNVVDREDDEDYRP